MTVVRLPSSIEVIVSRPIRCTLTFGTGRVTLGDAVLLVAGALVPGELLGVLAGFWLAGVVSAGVVSEGVVLERSVSATGAAADAPGAVDAEEVASVFPAPAAGAAPADVDPPSVWTETNGFWPGISTMTVVRVPSSMDMIVS